jgi:hypothetical protein
MISISEFKGMRIGHRQVRIDVVLSMDCVTQCDDDDAMYHCAFSVSMVQQHTEAKVQPPLQNGSIVLYLRIQCVLYLAQFSTHYLMGIANPMNSRYFTRP